MLDKFKTHFLLNHLVLMFLALFLFAVFFSAFKTKVSSATLTYNFQGKIVEKPTGTNISASNTSCIKVASNDTCDFKISIFDSITGGSKLWSEIHTDVEIGDTTGLFSINIGNYCISQMSGSLVTDGDGIGTRCEVLSGGVNLASNSEYFIQVEIDTADVLGENLFSSSEVFSRKKLTSSFYSKFSKTSSKLENNSSVITFDDVNTSSIPFSDSTYTSLPSGTNSILHALSVSGGGSNYFSVLSGNTYLTDTSSNFSIGSSTLTAPLSFTTSTNTLRIGDGVNDANDPTIQFFASDGTNSGNISFTDLDRFFVNGADFQIADEQKLIFGNDSDFSFSYDSFIDNRLEILHASQTLGAFESVTGQSYGNFRFSGTTILGESLAGSESVLYINPASNFSGKLLDLDINGVDIFEVTSSGITSEVPAFFNSIGNISIANNLEFTNNIFSQISSNSPLYITAGDALGNEDLILSANNLGKVVVDDNLKVMANIILGSSNANILGITSSGSVASDNLYWGDKLVCDVTLSNCGISNYFGTSGGNTYLSDINSGFSVGGTSSNAIFNINTSSQTLRLGSGGITNSKLNLYASDGNFSTFEMKPSDILSLNHTNFSFNDLNANFDFKISGTIDANLFFVDSSANKIGIKTGTPNSTLSINGTLSFVREVVNTDIQTNSDEIILSVTDTASVRTITLASVDNVSGRILIVKDESGGASSNNIIIDTQGSETIDGMASTLIGADYGSIQLYSNGTNWFSF